MNNDNDTITPDDVEIITFALHYWLANDPELNGLVFGHMMKNVLAKLNALTA